jgi:hypothetical protein
LSDLAAYEGRKLLVVSYQDKFMRYHQRTKHSRLAGLPCFIDNHNVEGLVDKQG